MPFTYNNTAAQMAAEAAKRAQEEERKRKEREAAQLKARQEAARLRAEAQARKAKNDAGFSAKNQDKAVAAKATQQNAAQETARVGAKLQTRKATQLNAGQEAARLKAEAQAKQAKEAAGIQPQVTPAKSTPEKTKPAPVQPKASQPVKKEIPRKTGEVFKPTVKTYTPPAGLQPVHTQSVYPVTQKNPATMTWAEKAALGRLTNGQGQSQAYFDQLAADMQNPGSGAAYDPYQPNKSTLQWAIDAFEGKYQNFGDDFFAETAWLQDPKYEHRLPETLNISKAGFKDWTPLEIQAYARNVLDMHREETNNARDQWSSMVTNAEDFYKTFEQVRGRRPTIEEFLGSINMADYPMLLKMDESRNLGEAGSAAPVILNYHIGYSREKVYGLYNALMHQQTLDPAQDYTEDAIKYNMRWASPTTPEQPGRSQYKSVNSVASMTPAQVSSAREDIRYNGSRQELAELEAAVYKKTHTDYDDYGIPAYVDADYFAAHDAYFMPIIESKLEFDPNGQGNFPKPGKDAPYSVKAAYAYWQKKQREPDTQKVEQELRDLRAYLANEYTYLKDEVDAGTYSLTENINWNDYPTLAKFMEGTGKVDLNRPVYASKQYVQGVIDRLKLGQDVTSDDVDYALDSKYAAAAQAGKHAGNETRPTLVQGTTGAYAGQVPVTGAAFTNASTGPTAPSTGVRMNPGALTPAALAMLKDDGLIMQEEIDQFKEDQTAAEATGMTAGGVKAQSIEVGDTTKMSRGDLLSVLKEVNRALDAGTAFDPTDKPNPVVFEHEDQMRLLGEEQAKVMDALKALGLNDQEIAAALETQLYTDAGEPVSRDGEGGHGAWADSKLPWDKPEEEPATPSGAGFGGGRHSTGAGGGKSGSGAWLGAPITAPAGGGQGGQGAWFPAPTGQGGHGAWIPAKLTSNEKTVYEYLEQGWDPPAELVLKAQGPVGMGFVGQIQGERDFFANQAYNYVVKKYPWLTKDEADAEANALIAKTTQYAIDQLDDNAYKAATDLTGPGAPDWTTNLIAGALTNQAVITQNVVNSLDSTNAWSVASLAEGWAKIRAPWYAQELGENYTFEQARALDPHLDSLAAAADRVSATGNAFAGDYSNVNFGGAIVAPITQGVTDQAVMSIMTAGLGGIFGGLARTITAAANPFVSELPAVISRLPSVAGKIAEFLLTNSPYTVRAYVQYAQEARAAGKAENKVNEFAMYGTITQGLIESYLGKLYGQAFTGAKNIVRSITKDAVSGAAPTIEKIGGGLLNYFKTVLPTSLGEAAEEGVQVITDAVGREQILGQKQDWASWSNMAQDIQYGSFDPAELNGTMVEEAFYNSIMGGATSLVTVMTFGAAGAADGKADPKAIRLLEQLTKADNAGAIVTEAASRKLYEESRGAATFDSAPVSEAPATADEAVTPEEEAAKKRKERTADGVSPVAQQLLEYDEQMQPVITEAVVKAEVNARVQQDEANGALADLDSMANATNVMVKRVENGVQKAKEVVDGLGQQMQDNNARLQALYATAYDTMTPLASGAKQAAGNLQAQLTKLAGDLEAAQVKYAEAQAELELLQGKKLAEKNKAESELAAQHEAEVRQEIAAQEQQELKAGKEAMPKLEQTGRQETPNVARTNTTLARGSGAIKADIDQFDKELYALQKEEWALEERYSKKDVPPDERVRIAARRDVLGRSMYSLSSKISALEKELRSAGNSEPTADKRVQAVSAAPQNVPVQMNPEPAVEPQDPLAALKEQGYLLVGQSNDSYLLEDDEWYYVLPIGATNINAATLKTDSKQEAVDAIENPKAPEIPKGDAQDPSGVLGEVWRQVTNWHKLVGDVALSAFTAKRFMTNALDSMLKNSEKTRADIADKFRNGVYSVEANPDQVQSYATARAQIQAIGSMISVVKGKAQGVGNFVTEYAQRLYDGLQSADPVESQMVYPGMETDLKALDKAMKAAAKATKESQLAPIMKTLGEIKQRISEGLDKARAEIGGGALLTEYQRRIGVIDTAIRRVYDDTLSPAFQQLAEIATLRELRNAYTKRVKRLEAMGVTAETPSTMKPVNQFQYNLAEMPPAKLEALRTEVEGDLAADQRQAARVENVDTTKTERKAQLLSDIDTQIQANKQNGADDYAGLSDDELQTRVRDLAGEADSIWERIAELQDSLDGIGDRAEKNKVYQQIEALRENHRAAQEQSRFALRALGRRRNAARRSEGAHTTIDGQIAKEFRDTGRNLPEAVNQNDPLVGSLSDIEENYISNDDESFESVKRNERFEQGGLNEDSAGEDVNQYYDKVEKVRGEYAQRIKGADQESLWTTLLNLSLRAQQLSEEASIPAKDKAARIRQSEIKAKLARIKGVAMLVAKNIKGISYDLKNMIVGGALDTLLTQNSNNPAQTSPVPSAVTEAIDTSDMTPAQKKEARTEAEATAKAMDEVRPVSEVLNEVHNSEVVKEIGRQQQSAQNAMPGEALYGEPKSALMTAVEDISTGARTPEQVAAERAQSRAMTDQLPDPSDFKPQKATNNLTAQVLYRMLGKTNSYISMVQATIDELTQQAENSKTNVEREHYITQKKRAIDYRTRLKVKRNEINAAMEGSEVKLDAAQLEFVDNARTKTPDDMTGLVANLTDSKRRAEMVRWANEVLSRLSEMEIQTPSHDTIIRILSTGRNEQQLQRNRDTANAVMSAKHQVDEMLEPINARLMELADLIPGLGGKDRADAEAETGRLTLQRDALEAESENLKANADLMYRDSAPNLEDAIFGEGLSGRLPASIVADELVYIDQGLRDRAKWGRGFANRMNMVGETSQERIFEGFLGKKIGGLFNAINIQPIIEHNAQIARHMNRFWTDVREAGLSRDNAKIVQMFGENLVSQAQLMAMRPDDYKTIIKVVDTMRRHYDEMHADLNKLFAANGIPPTPYRQNYFTHFTKGEHPLLALFGMKQNPDLMPLGIVGKTAEFEPNKKWFSSLLQRKGNETEYDAIEGMMRYTAGAMQVLYHAQDTIRTRQLTRAIGDSETFLSITDPRVKSGYVQFVEHLEALANNLAGKRTDLDRALHLGPAVDSIVAGYGQSKVLGNLKSMLNQLPASVMTALVKGRENSFIALSQMVMGSRDGSNAAYKNMSTYLTSRYPVNPIQPTTYKAVKAWIGEGMKGMEEFGTTLFHRTMFNKYQRAGNNVERAMAYADTQARRLLSTRNVGERGMFHNSTAGRALLQFMYEGTNQTISLFKENSPLEMLALLIAGWLVGKIGLNGTLNPAGSVEKAVKQRTDDESWVDTSLKAGQLVLESIIPAGIDLSNGVVKIPMVVGAYDTVADFKTGTPEGIAAGVLNWFPGGAQAEKIMRGSIALNKGYSESDAGNVRYPLDRDAWDYAIAPSLGVGMTGEGRAYTESGGRPLTDDRSNKFKTQVNAGVDTTRAFQNVTGTPDAKQATRAAANVTKTGDRVTGMQQEQAAQQQRREVTIPSDLPVWAVNRAAENDPDVTPAITAYQQTGDITMLPKATPDYLESDGKRVELTPDMQVEFDALYEKLFRARMHGLGKNTAPDKVKDAASSAWSTAVKNYVTAKWKKIS